MTLPPNPTQSDLVRLLTASVPLQGRVALDLRFEAQGLTRVGRRNTSWISAEREPVAERLGEDRAPERRLAYWFRPACARARQCHRWASTPDETAFRAEVFASRGCRSEVGRHRAQRDQALDEPQRFGVRLVGEVPGVEARGVADATAAESGERPVKDPEPRAALGGNAAGEPCCAFTCALPCRNRVAGGTHRRSRERVEVLGAAGRRSRRCKPAGTLRRPDRRIADCRGTVRPPASTRAPSHRRPPRGSRDARDAAGRSGDLASSYLALLNSTC